MPLETITWRVEVAAPQPEIPQEEDEGQSPRSLDEALKGEREIYLPENDGFAAVRSTTATGSTLELPSRDRPSWRSGSLR